MKKEAMVITKSQLRQMIQEAVINEQENRGDLADSYESIIAMLDEVERVGKWPRLHRALAEGSPNTRNLMVLAAERLERAAQKLRNPDQKS